jgi:hypothetical protein
LFVVATRCGGRVVRTVVITFFCEAFFVLCWDGISVGAMVDGLRSMLGVCVGCSLEEHQGEVLVLLVVATGLGGASCNNNCNDSLFVLCEDEFALCFLIPRLGCGCGLFLCLGCFSVCVGMRRRWGVWWMGWDRMGKNVGCLLFWSCVLQPL